MQNILVTGGCGFIGSAVIRNLMKSDLYNVCNIDNLTYAGNLDSLESISNNENYIFKKADICDFNKIQNILNEFKPDKIMHLAAESHVDRSIDGPDIFVNTNIIGTYKMLEASKKYFELLDSSRQRNFRFHHISTDEVYGDLKGAKDLFTEKTSYSPSSPYSASKASSDHLVRAWGHTYNLPIIITNCSNNYGPYQFPEKLIPHIIINAINGKSLPIYGDGSQIRDWLYVEDHAKALVKVVTEGKIGETYNIGGHNEKTNLAVVHAICDLLEELLPEKPKEVINFRDLVAFVKDRPGHDQRYAVDASKIEHDLGWLPEETFESGLRKTVKWYIDNSSWWQRVISGEYRIKRPVK